MNLTVETPALLFPAIALLLLAYTNRYHFIVTLIRELITRCESEGMCDISTVDQCRLLKKRILLVRRMQQLLVMSLLICVFCIVTIAFGFEFAGNSLFIFSIITFVSSLLISLKEVTISVQAITTLLDKYID
jgi:hypothetical protein